MVVALPETEAAGAATSSRLPPPARAGGGARRRHRAVGRRAAAVATACCCRSRVSCASSNIDPLRAPRACSPACAIWRFPRPPRRWAFITRPIPSSQIACSIGGNVAENAGGMHCLKYGLTVHNILKLRACTIEGELLEIGGDGLDAAGYDLLALMTGSEGLLAVDHRNHRQAAAEAGARAMRTRRLRRHRQSRPGGRRHHRRRHHSRRPRNDGQDHHRRGRALRQRRLSARRRGDPAVRIRRQRRRSRRGNRAHESGDAGEAAPPKSAFRGTKPSGCASGPGARRRSPRPAASRPITTAWTARSRERRCRACSMRSPICRRNTACAA